MSTVKKIAKIAVPALLLSAPFLALALPAPNPDTSSAITVNDVLAWINRVMNWILGIAMVIAVIFIVWGGILYITARGNDKQTEKAWATIKNGIIGAAIVLAVGLILQTLAYLVNSKGGLLF